MRGFFVTGTGTEVGKTVVAAALAHSARAEGARVAVFKPAVSGLEDYPLRPEVWECAAGLPDHALLRLAARSRQGDDEIVPSIRARRLTIEAVREAGLTRAARVHPAAVICWAAAHGRGCPSGSRSPLAPVHATA
jgi:hypothetical protein